VDKLLEEVDEAQAGALRAAEMDVTRREGSLKAMRAEVRATLLVLGARLGRSLYLYRVLSEFRGANCCSCLCSIVSCALCTACTVLCVEVY
jgi:hypothetical protein